MKKVSLWILLLAAAPLRAENVDPTLSEVDASTTVPPVTIPVRVVHPREGAPLPAVARSFAYGWAEPGGTLTVNGATVTIHPGGGWLAMVNYAPGPNTIRVVYEKEGASAAIDRRVTVAGYGSGPGPDSFRPSEDVGVAPGELVAVSFRGPQGGSAHFHLDGGKKVPMSWAAGTWRGFLTAPAEPLNRAKIKIQYKPASGKGFTKDAPGRLTVLMPDAPLVVETSTDIAVLRAGPGFSERDTAGYVMYPSAGTRLRVTGFQGAEYRVRLTRDRDLWIPRKEVRELPPGTSLPLAVSHAARVRAEGQDAVVRLAITQKAPFEVRATEDQRIIEVLFYGAYSNTDWIHPSADVPWVRQVRWFQDASDVLRLSVETDPGAWWGYDADYAGGGFELRLRRPPPPPADRRAPILQGLTVAVDPGHSEDTGAIGVTGTLEKDLNLDIAECLREKLEAERATVVMLRESNSHVPLYERPRLARASAADLLISVHNNALPEGEDPFEKNGFGVYYYHPHSLAFAKAVHEAYRDKFLTGKNTSRTMMRDDGLHWGNLALPRTPQMPAILTESAYMIYPPEEYALRQPSFQCDCAEAMVEGIRRFVRKARASQAPAGAR